MNIRSLHDLHDKEMLDTLLHQPEGQQLEFKTHLPQTNTMVRHLASFANADGGVLIVGFDGETQRVVGVDEYSRFDAVVKRSLSRLDPCPSTITWGEVPHPDGLLAAVIIWPSPDRVLKFNGEIYARRGPRILKYADAVELQDARRPSKPSVRLFLPSSQLDNFLDAANEDVFTDLLVAPLLRDSGFSLARKGHHDKTLEFGQDMRAMKFRLPTGHLLYFAAQIKSGAIGYSPRRTDSIDKILEQLRMAYNTPMTFWDTRSEHRPDHVFLVASGNIAEGARLYLKERVLADRMPLLFWDRELIVDYCAQRGLPEPVQQDISRYLEAPLDDNAPL